MGLYELLKKIPLDLGQKELRYKTKSSLMALELAGRGCGRLALDAGCANGYWSERLKQNGWKVLSLDKNSEYPKAIKHNLNCRLPFPDQVFDLVFSTAVIAYLDDPQSYTEEIKRVLKPDGKYVITTPNIKFWLDYLLRLFGASLKKIADQDQKHYFDFQQIKELFPRSSICGYFPYAIVKFKIKKMVDLLSPVFIIYGTKTNL